MFEKYYDYGFAEAGNCVKQTYDGGYIVAGRQGIAIGVSKVLLIKTDTNGIVTWSKLIGGPNDNYAFSVVQTFDSGYVLTGFTTGLFPSDYDLYVVRTDANGDTLWTKRYGPNVPNQFDCGWELQRTSDSCYIIAGRTGSQGWLLKIDSLGDTLWTRKILPLSSTGVELSSIWQTSDGGYILTGTTNSTITGNDLIIVKTNSVGDTLWTRSIEGPAAESGLSIQQTLDGGYIIGGATASYGAGSWDFYLVKADINGDTLWTRTFGGTGDDNARSVQQTIDGGFILAGSTSSFGEGQYDMFLVKADINGNSMWSKTFGGGASEYGYSVRQTSDGGFIMTGMANLFTQGDVYLVKTDSLGNTLTGIESSIPTPQSEIIVFPNPCIDFTTITLEASLFSKNVKLQLCDLSGRLIKIGEFQSNSLTFDVAELDNGLYLLNVIIENSKVVSKKIVVQH